MQKIIFREDNKSFNKINDITLFEGEENADYLEILIPQKYNEIDLSDCNIRLTYITSDDSEKSFLIDEYKQDVLYKDNLLVYLINIDKRFTSVVGEIKMYLTFSKSDEKDILFESGVATIHIKDHPSGSNELTEKELDIIDQVVLISNKALKISEDIEDRVNNGEFFPTIEVIETENGHNVTFKTDEQEETVEVKNGKDYVLTDEDKTDITQEIVDIVTPNIDEQVAKAEKTLDEKANQKSEEINVSLDGHKTTIINDINTVTNNNINNINNVTNTNISNINNITNNVVGTIIPDAKNAVVLDINNTKSEVLHDINKQKNVAINDIVDRENVALNNLTKQENTLAANLNENANQHIINIDTEAEKKITEIDEKVVDLKSELTAVEVSDTEPTNENVDVWINSTEDDSFNIPEIKDDEINDEDTWSSKKINSELEEVNKELSTKISEPSTIPEEVGKFLKVNSINEDGTFSCEWADVPSNYDDTEIKNELDKKASIEYVDTAIKQMSEQIGVVEQLADEINGEVV